MRNHDCVDAIYPHLELVRLFNVQEAKNFLRIRCAIPYALQSKLLKVGFFSDNRNFNSIFRDVKLTLHHSIATIKACSDMSLKLMVVSCANFDISVI